MSLEGQKIDVVSDATQMRFEACANQKLNQNQIEATTRIGWSPKATKEGGVAYAMKPNHHRDDADTATTRTETAMA